jgi:hypothetical protein
VTSTAALVAGLRARGVALEPRGHKLVIRPAGLVTPEEREELRRRKGAVLALLTVPPAAYRLLDAHAADELLGEHPDDGDLAGLALDVYQAVQELRAEIITGAIRPGLRLIRGRPLGDMVNLATVARLLDEWEARR